MTTPAMRSSTFRPRRGRLWAARAVGIVLAAVFLTWLIPSGTYLDRTGLDWLALTCAVMLLASCALLGRIRVDLDDDGVTAVGPLRRVVVPWSLVERAHSSRQIGLAIRAHGRGWVHLCAASVFTISDLEKIEQAVEDEKLTRDCFDPSSSEPVVARPPRSLLIGVYLAFVGIVACWLLATGRSGWGGLAGGATGLVVALLIGRRQLRRLDRDGL